jgi:hypothetical protein
MEDRGTEQTKKLGRTTWKLHRKEGIGVVGWMRLKMKDNIIHLTSLSGHSLRFREKIFAVSSSSVLKNPCYNTAYASSRV